MQFALHLFYQWITHTHKALSWAVLSSFIISTISLLIFKAVNQAKPLRVQLTCDDVNKSCLFLLVASSSVARVWNTWDETTRQTNIWSGKVLGVMYKMYCFWLWYVICVSIKSNSSLLDRNDAIQCSFVLFLLCWQQSAVWSLDSVTDSLHDARMSYYDAVIAILTILVSLALVILLIGAAWWLMWKVGN